MYTRIKAILAFLVIASSIVTARPTSAQSYPTKPIRLIVPFGPGAATDVVARIYAAKLGEVLGQTVVVDNRPGAGGLIGTETAAKAQPDGYTVLSFGINQTISPALYKQLPYDPVRDFAHVSLYGTLPNILVVHPSVPAKNIKEFVTLAKAAPGSLRYMSSGIGASPHLTMELFKFRTGINIVHVPYRSAAQGITELVGGSLQASFNNLPAALGNIKLGRLRGLAVTSAKRAEQLPEVPTIMESGVPDFEVTVWGGLAVPVATPGPIVDRLHAVMMKTLTAPDLKQRFAEQGVTTAPITRQEFVTFVKSEVAKWAKVINDSGTKVD
jgi:tripartite-type tricarboxylate transporter receptor subunit TctC